MEGNTKIETELEAVQMKAAKIVLGCSRRTSNAAGRAEMRTQSLRTGEAQGTAELAVPYAGNGARKIAENW